LIGWRSPTDPDQTQGGDGGEDEQQAIEKLLWDFTYNPPAAHQPQ
jgi:hypothetical protein